MSDDKTHFDLPNAPEEFSVKLPTADLRKIDFTSLEFDTLTRAAVEYLKTYYPSQFNDFVDNNGIIMLIDLICFISSTIAERGEVLVQESFLPTAFSREAVSNHLALINEQIGAATPATIDVEVSVPVPVATVLPIPAGTTFNLSGADGKTLTYEIYRSPNNWTDPIQILPGKRGVVAFGIEGKFETPFVVVSSGGSNQSIDIINDSNILDEPIFIDLRSGSFVERWNRVDIIERSGPDDKVYEVDRISGGIRVKFGDDKAGKAPLAGQEATIYYRIGGGTRGRIGSNRINTTRPFQPNPPASAPVEVTFRNLNPSQGGMDEETIDDAKKRAPKEAATLKAAVSGPDYATLASTFSHPVFGTIFKAVATVRTSLNANVVEVYALAEGENEPVKPSLGLKDGLISYLEENNVLTDEVRVLDGEIKRVKLEANIILNRNAIASIVKDQVESAIDNLFDVTKMEMGQELHIADIYSTIKSIDGVSFATIFQPTDDILKTGKLADPNTHGVGINELIMLGEKQLRFYYEV